MKIKKKRRREGKTDFGRRKEFLKSGKKRLVIRKSNKKIRAQIIESNKEGDKTLVDVTSKELREYGWEGNFNNIPAAYLTGLLLGKKAKGKEIEECIPDLGMKKPTPNSRLYACMKGVIDASVAVPHSKRVFPSEDRIKGKHIAEYGKKMKEEEPERFKEVFSRENPLKIPKMFEKVKGDINA